MASKRFVCTNFGCEREVEECEDNGVCVHHPGQPFFHDAYKGWTCCQQKSTDFTTFLNFKGCQNGRHSKEPKMAVKKTETPRPEPPPPSRPPEDNTTEGQFTEIQISESKTLASRPPEVLDNSETEIRCKKCGGNDVTRECIYHFGSTIFHETLKYWNCCPNKKFTDFQDFQEFKGCQRDDHHVMEPVIQKPRLDWFQTLNNVNVVLYGLKGARINGGSHVTCDGRTLRACLKSSDGRELWKEEWRFEHVVDVNESHVTIGHNKVEMVFKKQIHVNWIQMKEK